MANHAKSRLFRAQQKKSDAQHSTTKTDSNGQGLGGETKLVSYSQGIRVISEKIFDKPMILNRTCWKIILDCNKWNITWFQMISNYPYPPSQRLIAKIEIVEKNVKYHPFIGGMFFENPYSNAKYSVFFEQKWMDYFVGTTRN